MDSPAASRPQMPWYSNTLKEDLDPGVDYDPDVDAPLRSSPGPAIQVRFQTRTRRCPL